MTAQTLNPSPLKGAANAVGAGTPRLRLSTNPDTNARRLAMAPRDHWDVWLTSWLTHLRARNMQPSTVVNYRACMTNFVTWARGAGLLDPLALTRHDIEAWMADAATMVSPRTGLVRKATTTAMEYRVLRVFYRWLCDEEEDMRNPTAKVKAPMTRAKMTDVLTVDELRRLVGACAGRSFVDRRDVAIIRLLLDTGVRRAELLALTVDDVNLAERVVEIRSGKGGRFRRVAVSDRTAEALERYLRARGRHDHGERSAWLWLADGGLTRGAALGTTGLRMMLNRRGAEAGVSNVHPHRFRHTAYDAYAEAGGSDRNAMATFGWQSPAMLGHYAASAAERRAINEAHRLATGDRV